MDLKKPFTSLRLGLFLLLLFSVPSLQGQDGEKDDGSDEGDVWSLKECVEYAHENNLQVRQEELSAKSTEWDRKQSYYDLLPSLNAFGNHGYNWGQRIDQFTNQFVTRRVRSNSFSLSSEIVLFQGMQRLRSIQQREHELDAAEARVERAKNEIALSIATTYLQLLFDKEMLEVRRSQRDRTRQQVERMRKLHRAGQVSKGEVLDVVSQLESEKLNLTQARNQLRSSRLELVQLLQLDREEGGELKVQAPPEDELEGDSIRKSPEEIFARSLSEMPSIEVAEASIKGAEDALRSAQGGRSPTLSLSGSYGTGFSGQRRRPVGEPEIAGFDTIGRTASSGEAVLRPRIDQNVETVPFMEQLEDNMNQNVGLQLSIPIFQRMANHTRIKKAEVQLRKARLEKESARNQLRQDIQKAYNDVISAMRNYEASKKAVEARRESFSYAEARYEAGELNTVDYVDAKTKLVQARSEMLQAKYEQLFKRKVLRFYLGDPLTLQDTP